MKNTLELLLLILENSYVRPPVVGFFPGFLYDSFSIISDARWHIEEHKPV